MTSLPKIAQLGDECCGCGACAARCPESCIIMKHDNCGFSYPKVKADVCTGCGACDAVCSSLDKRKVTEPLSAWWAKSCDDGERLRSSSGGMFALFAHRAIADGGIVVGAAWEPGCRRLRHVVVEDEAALDSVMRSKYVQSAVGPEVYYAVRAALRTDRRVLFAGTACQVAAMRSYLGRLAESEGFLSVDVICHGVSSPLLWERWVEHRESAVGAKMREVNFRSKTTGWLSYCVQYAYCTQKEAPPHVEGGVFSRDWYMQAFLANASLRSSCFTCSAKHSCGSDVTLGDYWGVQSAHPEVDYENGVSSVLVRTLKGSAALEDVRPSIACGESSYAKVLAGNPSLERPVAPYAQREEFMLALADGMGIAEMMERWDFVPTFAQRVRSKLGGINRRLGKVLGR